MILDADWLVHGTQWISKMMQFSIGSEGTIHP
jgi:hypothetical protein